MDQKILSELGDYLIAHREEIINEWLRAVERNADISSPDHHLNYKELVDHFRFALYLRSIVFFRDQKFLDSKKTVKNLRLIRPRFLLARDSTGLCPTRQLTLD
jgi:hypothetical protein